jgi:hypothetical protein
VLGAVLLVLLILLLVGALPTWGHCRDWGYFPGGGLGVLVLVRFDICGSIPLTGASSYAAARTRITSSNWQSPLCERQLPPRKVT